MSATPVFHPERLIAVLGRFKVKYVLIGGVAARLHGVPWMTAIADIAPDPRADNIAALAQALRHLGARVFLPAAPGGLEFDPTPDVLGRSGSWELITSCGRLNVITRPGGTNGFDELAPTAARFDLHGDTIMVAELGALARVKAAEPSADEGIELALLRAMIERRSRDAQSK